MSCFLRSPPGPPSGSLVTRESTPTSAGLAVGVEGVGKMSETQTWCLAAPALEIKKATSQEEKRGTREPKPGLGRLREDAELTAQTLQSIGHGYL